MEIEIITHDVEKNTLVFRLMDSNPAFANALRRILLMEIPILAVDEVIILENTTPLYDEIIASRLGLVPLTTPVGDYNFREECSCDGHGCTQCEVSLTLEHEGETAGGIETVFSGELIPEDPKVAPVIENVPVLRMTKGQRITVQAIARLGQGNRHAKWQAGIASYKYEPLITIDNEKNFNWDEVVKACPPRILESADGELSVTDTTKCILCGLCEEATPVPGSIVVDTTGKDFIFTLVSLGQIPPLELLKESLRVLESKATEMKNKIHDLSIPDKPRKLP